MPGQPFIAVIGSFQSADALCLLAVEHTWFLMTTTATKCCHRGCGLEACMTASSGRTAICLGASRAQNCLTAGCKQWDAAGTHASQVMERSFGVLCRTQHIHPARHWYQQ
ncbi:uncharacterized protein LOC142768768 isoform X2 [Rhipicephalus microplus]|uniref:uncharacterized protein LOC142768768 isoform X2 n=1 Tax=Rhipicephalus microplus TaxID=6941 RepID=UPI003F6CC903